MLEIGDGVVQLASVERDLGVLVDQELTFKEHVAKIASSCFYQLRRLKQVRRYVDNDVMAQLVAAFVTSRLDYCNGVLVGLPKSTIAPVQRVQNVAARLVLGLRLFDHTTPALRQLHWLPVSRNRFVSRLPADIVRRKVRRPVGKSAPLRNRISPAL